MTRRDPFFDHLQAEMAMRARLLLAGANRGKSGRMLPEDLVQEALAKLLNAYDEASLRERPFNQLMALAYRTMRNLMIDQGRKKAAYLEDARDDDLERPTPDEAPLADSLLEDEQRSTRLREQLAKLSPEERCFLTNVMTTDSVPAAQKSCGWPPKSPYYVLKKLLAQLREGFEEPSAAGG
ncbi:MAG: sigma-70 family RNA polymerase sigma factor [Myxococcales bacterium]|nr:sigma-70 family RNA polymerase sigma factor [Myxococcales bacterium]MCB9734757.1 sigma-70 family RNA polymerase sigma factor [Deltaproteobacteria bacterium]